MKRHFVLLGFKFGTLLEPTSKGTLSGGTGTNGVFTPSKLSRDQEAIGCQVNLSARVNGIVDEPNLSQTPYQDKGFVLMFCQAVSGQTIANQMM